MALRRFRPGTVGDEDVFPRRFSDLLDDFFSDVATREPRFVPRINVTETENEFQIEAELPGMSKDDIDVSLNNNQLTVSGKREHEEEDKQKTYHRVERSYGEFNRTFTLPDNVDEESIEATYDDGVLNISIKKSEDKVSKKIDIK